MSLPDASPPSAAPGGDARAAEGAGRGARRRRWPLVLGGVLLLLVVLVLLAPVIAASIARGRIEAAVAEKLHATASVGDLSLSLGGHVQARDIALTDEQGQPVAALAQLDVQANVLGALSGRYRGDVTLRGLVLHVRQGPDGRLNLETLPRSVAALDGGSARDRGTARLAGAASAADGGHDAGAAAIEGPLPDVGAHVLVEDASVFVHAADGRVTQLQLVSMTLELPALELPATYALDGRLSGPAGPAGGLQLGGTFTLAHGGRVDPALLAATLDYTLGNVLLAGLQPALDTLAPGAARDLRGTLAGSGHWAVDGLARINGTTEIRADGLHLQGAAADAPSLDLPSVQLSAAATVDGEGTGTQQLQLSAGDVLALRWDGTTQRLATPGGALAGTLTLDSRLGLLLALLREPLALKPGLDVAATLALRGGVTATLADGSLASLQLTSDLTLKDIAARDAHGAALDLGELTSASAGLDGRMDLGQGRFELSRLQLQAGPVQAAAHGSVGGLPVGGVAFDAAALTVADSELLLDADLDRLARAAGQFMDLGATAFGGKVHVKAVAMTTGRRVDASSSVELTGLRVRLPPAAGAAGASGAAGTASTTGTASAAGAAGGDAGAPAVAAARELGPLDLSFTQSARVDLSPGGACELTSLSLRSAFAELDGSGALTDAFDADRRAGSIKTTLRVKPGAASAQLAGLLDGLVADGQDVTIDATLQLQGGRTGVLAAVRAPSLALQGGALREQPLALSALALDAEVALDSTTQRLELKALKLAAGPTRAAGKDLPGLELTARGTWDGARGALDVPELQLVSGVANGGGKLSIDNLAQPGKGLAVLADMRFAGDAEPARALLAAFVPELATARAAGRWDVAVQADTAGTVTRATPRLALHGVSLDGYVAGGRALPLKDVDLALDAELSADTSGAGQLTLTKLALQAPGLTLTADGRASGYATPAAVPAGAIANPIPAALDASVNAGFTLQPRELSERLAAFLGGVALDGETATGQFRADVSHGALVAKGGLSSRELQVDLPADAATGRAARRIVQRDLQLDLDATADLSPGHDLLTLRTARYASRTAQASVNGTLGGLLQPQGASADVTLSVRSELAAVLADLGALLPLPGWSGSGALAVDGTLRGDAGRLALQSTTTIDKLFLSIPRPPAAPADAAAGGGAVASSGAAGAVAASGPMVIEDPHVAIDLDAILAPGPMDVDITRARVASTFLSGTLGGKLLALSSPVPRAEKLKGAFTWVPARVGALLGPLLPGQLTGDESQPLDFLLDGPLPSGDLPALLAGCNAGATIGLGQLALPGLTASGTTTLDMSGGRAHVTGKLLLNGGTADLDALLDLRRAGTPAAPLATALKLQMQGVQISQEMGELLARIHPLLAVAPGESVGVLSGAVGGSLQLDWPDVLPLPAATSASAAGAASGADADASLLATLPLEKLSGTALLDFGMLHIASSPLLGKMLGNLGLSETQQFAVSPVQLVVKDGRVAYAEPWGWNIKDVTTNFSGSVGLDQTLDLHWSVPITDALVAKHGFLKGLQGQTLAVPLRGTVADPDLQWTAALEGFAQQALQAKLQSKIEDKLGPLGGLLGGDKADGDKDGGDKGGSDKPAADAAPAVTPEELLAQADALWDKGAKEESKPLYKQLKNDFKLSFAYQLNKKRIDERAKWKP